MSVSYGGNIDFTIVEKAIKGFKFNIFMKKIIKYNNVIFMDNAIIHKNKQFINDTKNNKWNIIYNIPYHSHLNPIEYVFSMLRRNLLNACVESFDDIVNTILDFKKNINIKHIKNIFNKCLNDIKTS